MSVNVQVLFTCNIGTPVLPAWRCPQEYFPDPDDQEERRYNDDRKYGGGAEEGSKKDSQKSRKKITHESELACLCKINFMVGYK